MSNEDEKCCGNCANYEDAICVVWEEGSEYGIEDISNCDAEICAAWEDDDCG